MVTVEGLRWDGVKQRWLEWKSPCQSIWRTFPEMDLCHSPTFDWRSAMVGSAGRKWVGQDAQLPTGWKISIANELWDPAIWDGKKNPDLKLGCSMAARHPVSC